MTADGSTIAEAARRLVARGFGESAITVLENHGRSRSNGSVSFTAETLDHGVSPISTRWPSPAWRDRRRSSARALRALPDDDFMHDGQITKREVRAATLAALGPAPGQLLWDVGAGCGSIAIEWMRADRGATPSLSSGMRRGSG